jgi:outer membrane protein OmpA-like peptidoglycan-associated protein
MDEAQRAARFRLRSWRQVDPPAWPFVWRGLLPVLGLVALALFALTRFAHGWIEDAVAARTRTALDGAGLRWVQLEVSGQQVKLTGTAPAAPDGDQALEVARQARCPSWAGELVCAISVTGNFDAPPAAAASPEPAAGQAPAPAAEREAAACEGGLGALLGSSTVEFAPGSAVLAPSSGPLLDRVAEVAKTCPGTLRVEGHTDSTGGAASNLELSRARAEAVRRALVERGLPAERLVAEGFGQARPVAPNDDAAGRARNRRIELHVADGQR